MQRESDYQKDAVYSETTTLTPKCARNSRADSVCCKELKAEERMLIDPDVVRDALTVPFALTASLSSLGTSHLVILNGVAGLIAGAISMDIGGLLASQAERDHLCYLKNQTAARVVRSCSGEVEKVLGPIGVDELTCRAVAKSLRESGGEEEVYKDVGLTAFLLKFGQGMEEVPTRRLYISAFTISMGATSAQLTGASNSAYGIVWGAVSTLLVGGIAVGGAFGIVRALEGEQ
ncbi:hypothetical protein K435DRAFT_821422 [Dendrothele bispora CBS 962.96]|uniref:DUF125-domain-containing protein n=1 Tax=Dendrothele bispora (strain CBS 962.96) TaxID=1314807 RepID=A0A4S8LJN0_DENBC|nr:hypothetical protein K435DRAFT_821422 [Dendrothele bispora CBS 962.96]